ncbi:expressed unknown protein [Seminavis robusta]|uniref:Uncharacterized protein n=1 Tax=Seminavis robusta TaxID=568900 RepID=A0A9N8EWT5_9STRA|nr:expressed unknown protein [Seminavis robusta]|eukprot:Sro1926_g305860.1 n/a (718) ;mRNA; f:2267-4517
MRLFLALAAAQSIGLFLETTDAFSAAGWSFAHRYPRSFSVLRVGDDDGEIPSESLDGADLSDDMKEKMKSDDEQYGGGSRFREMMEKAQSRQAAEGPQTLKNPFVENPFAGIEGLDPATTPEQPPAAGLDPNALTVEQQAEMFRAMMQGQQAAPAPAPLYQNVRPPKPDRKEGRNRDADTIQNTADVYFAQLKRDSTVRGIARIRGDDEKANAVFEDEKIEELKGMISENPHLAGKREAEQKLIETAAEEMIAFQNAQEYKPSKGAAGPSYKQKLAERRKKMGGVGNAVAQTAPEPPKAEVAPQPAEPEAPKVEAPKVEAPPVPKIQAAPEQLILEEPPAASAPVPVEPQAEAQAQPPHIPPSPPQQSTSEWGSPNEIRQGLRTLMGLILKHRGGPGFGAGGLKGQEIGQYENLLAEITALLKEEAVSSADFSTPLQTVPVTAPAPAPAPQPVVTAAAPAAPASSSGDEIAIMLACIDGAITMYKNSPPELQEGVLMTVRAALLSAVNTISKALGENEGVPPSAAGAGGSVETMFGCVEGAIMMYRNSPPELQQGVLLTLRAALLSAINTCNKVIAENDVENFQQYQAATATMEKPPATTKPAQFYNVVPAEEVIEEASTTALDENSKVLESIYDKLQAAAGDGKLGLREDLTSEEATDLADSIAEMRAILMQELDTGIPEPQKTPAAVGSAAAASESTGSIYQQMLSQAREAKAAN